MVEWNPGLIGSVQRYNPTVAGTEPVAVPSSVRLTASAPGDELDIDVTAYSLAFIELDDDMTLTLSNVPDLGAGCWSVRLVIEQGDGPFAITWPTVRWVAGTAPTLSATLGDLDVIDLFTMDGGSTWFGVVVGQAFAEPA